MAESLFRPRQLVVPGTLILVPWLPALCRPANVTVRKILHAELLTGAGWSVLTGFLGYPDLLTLLAFIADWPAKRLVLLGTAGALDSRFAAPAIVQVEAIAASPPLRVFASHSPLDMELIGGAPWPAVHAVSVDLPQRETRSWLAAQRRGGRAAVEMELFPLRAFLGRPFPALLVFSDAVEAAGIRPFARESVCTEMARAFTFLMMSIQESQADSDVQVPG